MTRTTLLELAEVADAAYGGASSLRAISQDNWQPLKKFNGEPLTASTPDGSYYGIAYQNTITHEIVIANRGTRTDHFSDLWNDARLAAHSQTEDANAAIAFALQVAQANPGATIIETGHSLGGDEAQAGLAALVDRNINVSASAVVFQAPGLPTSYFANHSNPQNYPVLDLYNQGDVIHLAGGTRLGASRLLAAGPSGLTEFGHFALGFLAGELFSPLAGLALGGGRLAKDLAGSAHSIGTTISYLEGTGSAIGSDTMQQFLGTGQGMTPDPNLTANTDGSITWSNGSADSETLQAPVNGTIGVTATVASDGALTPAADAAAVTTELAADGPGTLADNLSSQVTDSLGAANTLYATVGYPGNGSGAGFVIGSTPPGASTGVPTQAFARDNAPGKRFEFNVPGSGQIAAETIVGGNGSGTVWVGGSAGFIQLQGGSPVPGTPDAWVDSNGTQYAFVGMPGSSQGTPTITKGRLGSNPANSINSYYQDTWVMASVYGIGGTEVDWTKMTNCPLTAKQQDGNWDLTRINVPVAPNAPVKTGLLSYTPGVGERLSFTGASFGSSRVTRACVTYLLCLICLIGTCGPIVTGHASEKDQSEDVKWPLGRSGRETLALKIPDAYGLANRAADAMERQTYPSGRPKFNDDVHEQLLLHALWPDLKSDGAQIHRESAVPGGGRLMSVLVDSGAVEDYGGRHYDSLKLAFDLATESSTQHLCVPPMEQAEYDQNTKTKCYPRDSPDAKPSKFGLNRVGVDFTKYPDIPQAARFDPNAQDIYYIRGSDGRLQTIILCTPEEAKTVEDGPQYHRVAQCEHKFVSERLNALVSIGYRRVYLKEWRALQQAWDQLLTSFVVNAARAVKKED